MRQVDDDYREAELKAYQSAGVGCVLAAVALLIAVGAAMWLVVWYFRELVSLSGSFG